MATEFGAVRTLPKPFKPANLQTAVSSCLDAAKQTSLRQGPDHDIASGS